MSMPGTGAPPAGPARRGTSGPAVAGVVVALLLVALGAVSLVDLAIHRTERHTRTWVGVSVLELDAGSGDVEVVAAGRGDVQVEQFERRTWRAPHTEAELRDGLLRLRARCPFFIGFGNCSVDYRIQAPAGTPVRVKEGSGDVRVEVVRTPPDTLTATSSSGDVRVVVPDEVYRVDAHTSSGNVDLSLRQDPDAPRRIEARTSSGDVVVQRG